MCAGIHLVIAENIERIYKQNCQNLGVLTSTNFSLIDKVRAGEEIPLTRIHRGRGRNHPAGHRIRRPVPLQRCAIAEEGFSAADQDSQSGPMTLAEKIFARHMLDSNGGGRPRPSSRAKSAVEAAVKPGDTGFARADLRFSHEYVTPMAAIFFEHYVGKDAKVNDPQHPVLPRSPDLSR